MKSPKQAIEELEAFESAEQIAQFLREKGIQGIPENSDHCPLANYFQIVTGRRVNVGEEIAMFQLDEPDARFRVDLEEFELPESCQAFVEFFDAGTYPDLEEQREAE